MGSSAARLQRAIQRGRLPRTADHRVDTTDLRRAGYPVPVSPDAALLSYLDTAPTPQEDAAPVAAVPQGRPATAESPTNLPPYILRIAEIAAEYDKLTLVDLSQLLFDRNIYRAHDRKTKAEKPVNKGTFQHWLQQARQAGVL